ncbi:MAG: chromosome segregation protein [Hyphomonadaceae bacterium]|nr:MAG: chromosome segregation protein [Hyphomonadaceae bacterium]
MKITDVKITGFKSFVDSVTLPIESGLTGIVGPNGCGKSNVLEALRWVMGATSAKALRGGEMDDIIFSGTDTRPSRDIAEVIVRLDNQDRSAPEPFNSAPNIEISRRIRRGIGSVFRINGKEVRARDVQLIFADASSGANSPALVRQGQIAELINAKPENRRRLLEEAAGIAGLQARRHEAQNKLAATENNLERVAEILVHLGEQISSLKKQAQKANKYRGLAAYIRAHEMFIALDRMLAMQKSLGDVRQDYDSANQMVGEFTIALNKSVRELENIEKLIGDARQEQAIADANLRRWEAKSIEIERDLKEMSEKSQSAIANLRRIESDQTREQELLADAQLNFDKCELELAGLSDNSSLDAEILALAEIAKSANIEVSEAETELSKAINHKAEIEAEYRNYLRTKERLLAEIANKDAQHKQALQNLAAKESQNNQKAEIETLRLELAKHEQNFIDANSELERFGQFTNEKEITHSELAQNHDALNNKNNRLKSELQGLNALIANAQKLGANPALNSVQVKSGFEKALAAAIGEDIEANIGDVGDNKWVGASDIAIDWAREIKGELTVLADVVSAPIELLPRLKSIAIVSDAVFENTQALSIGLRIVTLRGDLRRWDGHIKTRAALHPAQVKLEQLNRKQAITGELDGLQIQLAQSSVALAQAKSELQSHKNDSAAARAKLPQILQELNKAREKLSQQIAKNKQCDDEIIAARSRLISLEQDLVQAKTNHDEFQSSETEFDEASISIADDKAQAALQIANIARDALSIAKSNLQSRQINAQARKEASANLLTQKQGWQSRMANAQNRLDALSKDEALHKKLVAELAAKPQEIEARKQATLNELPVIEVRKRKADDEIAAIESKIRIAAADVKSNEQQLNHASEAVNTADFMLKTWLDRIEEHKTNIANNFFIEPEVLEAQTKEALANQFASMTHELAQKRLSKALQEREELGGVNLTADDELVEITARTENLELERNELLGALAKLRKAIDEINAEGHEKLLAAFEVVNAHFTQLFTSLFDGGAAHLSLSETDDPLGGGLEVYACPPGKRLQNMNLLSGGEQALTACALIFAVFLSNPAPISVLDEIDAPLDDANVDRFCRLLQEMVKRTDTKFVVITHHPITMAKMDRLFGVTMAERGVSQVVAVDLAKAEAMIEAA